MVAQLPTFQSVDAEGIYDFPGASCKAPVFTRLTAEQEANFYAAGELHGGQMARIPYRKPQTSSAAHASTSLIMDSGQDKRTRTDDRQDEGEEKKRKNPHREQPPDIEHLDRRALDNGCQQAPVGQRYPHQHRKRQIRRNSAVCRRKIGDDFVAGNGRGASGCRKRRNNAVRRR